MSEGVTLCDVYTMPNAKEFLYRVFCERRAHTWISRTSEEVPWWEHSQFVDSRPYRYWYIIYHDTTPVGEINVTKQNEIGLAILREHQGKGFGSDTIRKFVETHNPLPAIPSNRNGHWLANIAINNEASKEFFRRLGFRPLMETWVLEDGDAS